MAQAQKDAGFGSNGDIDQKVVDFAKKWYK